MTLLDPAEYDSTQFLFVQSVDFPQVLALPTTEHQPDADVLTFRFNNGYGATVTRLHGESASSAFEFCVLDCTQGQPVPTYLTPVAPHMMVGLSYDQVAQLLPQAERLPVHPDLLRADFTLRREEF